MTNSVRGIVRSLRDFGALITIINLTLVLILSVLHVFLYWTARMALQPFFEPEADLPDAIALASQMILLTVWLALGRQIPSNISAKNGKHLESLTTKFPNHDQVQSILAMASLVGRPAQATWDPHNIPFHRLLLFCTRDRRYAAVPLNPQTNFATAVQMDLAAVKFQPYKLAEAISAKQIQHMTFPANYRPNDGVMLFAISPEQLQIIASLHTEIRPRPAFSGAPKDEHEQKPVH